MLGFTLQYDLCYTQRADDARPGRHSAGGRRADAGPSAGDRRRAVRGRTPSRWPGSSTCSSSATAKRRLPAVCDAWLRIETSAGRDREAMLAEMAGRVAVCLRAAVLPSRRYESRRPAGAVAPACATTCPSRSSRPWSPISTRCRCPPRPVVPLRRVRARPDRHRDHARLSRAMPLLPEHDDQAAAAVPQGRDDRAGGAGDVPQHGLQRNLAAVAFDQRLSAVRRTDAAAARDVPPAGREHLAAQPADQRATAHGRRTDEHRPPLGPDAGARGRPRRHARSRSASRSPTRISTPAAAGRSRTAFRG